MGELAGYVPLYHVLLLPFQNPVLLVFEKILAHLNEPSQISLILCDATDLMEAFS